MLTLFQCRSPSGETSHAPLLPPYSREIARVGPYTIKEDLLRFYIALELDKFPKSFIKDNKNRFLSEDSPFKPVFDSVLDKLIEDHIILAYGEKQGIHTDEETLKQAFEKMKLTLGPKETESLISDKKIPYRKWRDMIEKGARIRHILDVELGENVRVSLPEIQQYYAQHRNEFSVPEEVRVRHIVTDSQEKAEEIFTRLKSGENFAKLAVNHSLSPDRAKGGDLGYFARGTFPVEFDNTCFDLEKGGISSIVKSDYGYHLFKLIDRKPAGVLELKDVMEKINHRLFEQKLKSRYEEWIKKVKKEIPVRMFEKNLKDFVL